MTNTQALRALCLFAGLTAALPASATEGGVFGGPIGGSDIRSANLPPVSGLYGAAIFLASNAPSFSNQYGNYSATSNPAYFTGLVEAGALLYVYPIKPLGFTLATSIQLNTQQLDQALTITPRLRLQQRAAGFGDSYSDFFYASKYLGLFGAQPGGIKKFNYGLTFAFGMAAELPIGRYNVNNFDNVGKNTFIAIPNVAFTYLTGPNLSIAEGTELSARVFYESVQKNPASLYHSGDIVDVDFAVTQRWENWQVGVAGAYATQLNGDVTAAGATASPNGNLYEKFILGPVIAYDSPELKTTFKLKATFGVHNENTYLNNTIVFSIARKLL